jgi:hypothetical protein
MVYWAACRLQPSRTALALHFLNLHGYEVYCPRLRELRVLRGRRVEVLLPLFPGYTFLRVVTGWWQARWAPGTCGLVMDGETPAKVPDAVIAEIRSREREGAIVCHPRYGQAIGCECYAVRSAITSRSTPACQGVTGSLSCSGCSVVSAGSFCPDAISRANGRAPTHCRSRVDRAVSFSCATLLV